MTTTKTVSQPVHITGRDNISKFINSESNKDFKERLIERGIKTRFVKKVSATTQQMTTDKRVIEKRSFWVTLTDDETKCLHFSKTLENSGK